MIKFGSIIGIVIVGINTFISCAEQLNQNKSMESGDLIADKYQEVDTATFGTGCFWCTEAVFQRLNGVSSVVSGYSGGTLPNPTYEQVCTGKTGYAEVCQIIYDPKVISYKELLKVFWKVHDPTSLNKQGNDVGPQYRSAIFYHNSEQQAIANQYKSELDKSEAYANPIVTEITAFDRFYPAEDYHQNYFNNNSGQAYCHFVIQPKLDKFEKVFKDQLSSNR